MDLSKLKENSEGVKKLLNDIFSTEKVLVEASGSDSFCEVKIKRNLDILPSENRFISVNGSLNWTIYIDEEDLCTYKRNKGEYYITLPKDLIDLLDLGYEKEVSSQALLEAFELTYDNYDKAKDDYRYSDVYNCRFDENFYTYKLQFLLKLLFEKLYENSDIEDIGEVGYAIEKFPFGKGYVAYLTNEFLSKDTYTIKMKALSYSKHTFNQNIDAVGKITGYGETEKKALQNLAEELKKFKVTGILKKSKYV